MSEKNLTTGKIWIIIDVRRLNVMLKKISLFYKLVKKWSHIGTVLLFLILALFMVSACKEMQELSFAKDTTPPPKVINLRAVSRNTKVLLEWDNPSDRDFDGVEISVTPPTGNLISPQRVIKKKPFFLVTNLTNGTKYTFFVKSIDRAYNKSKGVKTEATPDASSDTTPPADIESLRTTTQNNNGMLLEWNPPTDRDFYEVEISVTPASGNLKNPKRFTKETFFFTVTGLEDKKKYDFEIKTIDISGNRSSGKNKEAETSMFKIKDGRLKGYFGTTLPSEIKIPDAVIVVESGSFPDITNDITSIVLGKSLRSLENLPFESSKLAEIKVHPDNTNYKVAQDGVLFSNDNQTLYRYPRAKAGTSYEIPETVTTIEKKAFQGAEHLTSITIPATVTTLKDRVFQQCKELKTITIPSTVRSMGKSLFESCKTITEIKLPNKVTAIEYGMFSNCRALQDITIPAFVKCIGRSAFFGCEALKNIVIPNDVTTIGKDAFTYCTTLESFTIGEKINTLENLPLQNYSVKEIKVDSNNSHYTAVDGVLFSKDQKILYRYPSAKTEISNTVTAYTIPNTVTTIKSETFFSCQNLTSITIPNTVTTIENNAFYGVKKNMTIFVKTEEIKNLLINSGFTGEVELVP